MLCVEEVEEVKMVDGSGEVRKEERREEGRKEEEKKEKQAKSEKVERSNHASQCPNNEWPARHYVGSRCILRARLCTVRSNALKSTKNQHSRGGAVILGARARVPFALRCEQASPRSQSDSTHLNVLPEVNQTPHIIGRRR